MTSEGNNYIDALARAIRRRVPSSVLPEQPCDDLFLIYAVLLLAKGNDVTREDVHNGWAAWMSRIDPNHESLTPYAELPAGTRAEDEPFLSAIHAEARSRGERA